MKNRFNQLLLVLIIGACLAFFLHGQSHVTQTVITTLRPQLDVFQTGSPTYTLKYVPASQAQVMVFVGGLLMLQGLDYEMQGSALTFTGTPTGQMDNPAVQVMYWTVE